MTYALSEGAIDAPRSIGALLKFTYRESAEHVREVTRNFFYPSGDIDDAPINAIGMGSLVFGGFIALPFINFGEGAYKWYKAAKRDREFEKWRKRGKPLQAFRPEEDLEGNLE